MDNYGPANKALILTLGLREIFLSYSDYILGSSATSKKKV
jgi:hypothetical protein